jgi:hypothetical protein
MMVVVTAYSYEDLKALSTEVAADTCFARDGVATGIGFHALVCKMSEQVAFRYMQPTKPPTFDTDFPDAHYVRDFQVV